MKRLIKNSADTITADEISETDYVVIHKMGGGTKYCFFLCRVGADSYGWAGLVTQPLHSFLRGTFSSVKEAVEHPYSSNPEILIMNRTEFLDFVKGIDNE